MFNIFSQQSPPVRGSTVTIRLSGLHCTGCALNIDGILEDLAGVIESTTNYAKSESKIIYDEQKIQIDVIISEIEKAGYTAQLEPTPL